METLLLRLRADGSGEWMEGGTLRQDRLEALKQVQPGRRLVVLVPGRDVLLARVDIPSRRHGDIERALPYALEEWLVDAPETQHFAWRQNESGVNAAIVARNRVNGWLESLFSAGLAADALIPETLALPWRANEWSVLLADDNAWLRTGEFSGQACDRNVIEVVIKTLWSGLAETDRPKLLRVWCLNGEIPNELPVPVNSEPRPDSALSVFEVPGDGLNLLTGPYAPGTRLSHRWGPWRATTIAAAILLVSIFSLKAVQFYRLQGEVSALQTQINTLFHQSMPSTSRIVNPKAQMQQALDQLNPGASGAGFLYLLDRSSAVLMKVQNVHISQLTYSNDRLSLVLTVPQIGVFETLTSELRKRGLSVELGSVSSQNGLSKGQLNLTRG